MSVSKITSVWFLMKSKLLKEQKILQSNVALRRQESFSPRNGPPEHQFNIKFSKTGEISKFGEKTLQVLASVFLIIAATTETASFLLASAKGAK